MKKSIRLFISLLLVLFSIQVHAMTTRGTQILNANGEVVELKGVNWFGFNNQGTMVDGLWGGPDSLSFDFATVVYRMELLGFNAIRLPFSFKDLYNLPPRNYAQQCTVVTLSQIQASVTNPSVSVPSGKTIPPMVYSPTRQPNTCNGYLPNDTTLNRFLWVVNFFAKNGFYVLIDNHLREDQTVLENQATWVQDWVQLATAIAQDPISKDRVMIDILNEPDNFGVRWEASAGKPALKDLYLSVMDALYPINHNFLFFVEGTGQGGIGANWGDGFTTDPILISRNGLSDPNPFFKALLQKPYTNQVVISPHVYPPSVTNASTNYTGDGLWNRLSSSFGYLTQQGYCDGTNCKVFPVAIGEFGSRFTDARDIPSMQDIATYFNNTGAAADGKHKAIPNWFYWAWNANSGDTGGLVTDNWHDIVWNKIDYLTTIGLKPWYLDTTPAKQGTLCVTVTHVDGLTGQDLRAITAGNYTFEVTSFDAPVCESVQIGDYTVSAPQLTISGRTYTAEAQTISVLDGQTSSVSITYIESETPPPPPPPTSSVTVKVQLGTAWQETPGDSYKNVINLYITNTGDTTINVPWTLTLANSAYVGVTSFWNLKTASIQSGTITAATDIANSWENLAKNGENTINVGLIVSSTSPNFMPTTITVNGKTATITQ
jgi:hypothetical protein